MIYLPGTPTHTPIVGVCQWILLDVKRLAGNKKPAISNGFFTLLDLVGLFVGSPARTRTTDPMVNSHLLCRLSYWGIFRVVSYTVSDHMSFKASRD